MSFLKAMPRNRDTSGRPFTAEVRDAVWARGRVVEGHDPDVWRFDWFGNIIKFSEYGNTSSPLGWEIDHIRPVAKGGTDALANLQPLQWEDNRDKGDTWPWP